MDNLSWKFNKIDDVLCKKLEHGKAFLCSTDTVLGLMTPVNREGKDTLDTIKKRINKPYLIIIGSLSQTEYFIESETKAALFPLFKALWPGPTSLIIPAKKGLPLYCVSSENTVALRFPAHEGLQKAALLYNGIFSTSANIHGMPIPKTVAEVDPAILNHIAAIIIDDTSAEPVTPSTIIDCTTKPYTIVREGLYPKEKLLALLSHY